MNEDAEMQQLSTELRRLKKELQTAILNPGTKLQVRKASLYLRLEF